MKSKTGNAAFKVATISLLAALCVVVILLLRIPFAPTKGYLNIVDAVVYFAGFTFGPITGFLAGGLGPAIADIIVGWGQWAPFSLVAHGVQGFMAGLMIFLIRKQNKAAVLGFATGGLTGTIVMVAAYFAAGSILVGTAAAASEIPINLLQNALGLAIGIPLTLTVRKAYPPITNYRF